ncbi:putative RING/U-box superfamily protein [Hibiscus syriacus]|uniref:RING-type E3 ubiquitin transferase n=1 Tax=Hibiscus syriacus TaxID=106335 RepID=A0A6A2WCJ3_HIBSY|nr:putative RING/U-box superfamily protein [Hibiscus syriacus]
MYTPDVQMQPNPETHRNSSDIYTTAYNNGFNVIGNIVFTVLSILFFSVICSLGLISITRFVSRFPSLLVSEHRLSNTGVKRKALKTFPKVNYSTELKLPGFDSECVKCLSDFRPMTACGCCPSVTTGFMFDASTSG